MTFTLLDAFGSPRALGAFLSLPDDVYHGDSRYSAIPREDVMAGLHRRDLVRAQRVLVATEDDLPFARVVARRSPTLKDAQGLPLGMLGFFEAMEGPEGKEAARLLLAEGVRWLREAGAGEIVGPMDGDTWHRHRLNAGPFDNPPFLLEPWNPPYYPEIWEEAGFQVLESYASTQVETAAAITHLEPKATAAREAGYQLRSLDMRRFSDELLLMYRLSRAMFAGNFLYTDIPQEEFLELYAGARTLLDPELVLFARSPAGEDVGFLFAYPDRFRAVAAMRGKRSLLAKLRFLRHRNEAGAVDFKTVGVLPEHRRARVAALLMHEGHVRAERKGYRLANHCLFREGNPSGDLAGSTARLLRRYHLYRWRG